MRNKKHLRTILILNLIFFISCISPVYISAQKAVDKNLTPRQIAQQTLPSTVLLVMNNSDTKEAKSGSGFFIAEDIVVTNFHVIKETTEGYAKIYGQDKIYEISGVVGTDEKNDLALLKIKGIKGKALKLNTDDSTAIGDEVFAVGNPKGLEGTFSQGIISSIRKTGKFNLLQITASISTGSSGGAVLNDSGEVIGVAVGAIESGQSLNFAIPVSLLRSLVSNQTSLKSLASQTAVAENKVQPSRKVEPKHPSNLPTIKAVPQRKSKIQFKTPDLVEENLFGKVKSTRESVYFPERKFDEWILGETITVTTDAYNLDGYKASSEEVVYSEKNIYENIALAYIYQVDLDTKELPFTVKYLYNYDYLNGLMAQENYIKCASCSTYKLKNKLLIKYQEGEKTIFDSNGVITHKEITRQQKDGKFFVESFDENGKLYRKEVTYKNKVGEVNEVGYVSKDNKKKTDVIDEIVEASLESKTITTEERGQLKETSICIKNGKEIECNRYVLRDKATKLVLRDVNGYTAPR
ncbi:MAG TPA: S1C family serine protease [Pyrinomonadaceae bacterium]|nr:S1C family serine protease [Pyrinomonadaceae bacterium]